MNEKQVIINQKQIQQESVYRLAQAAMFLALGMLLPFVTGQIPQIGTMLLPMHIPVFLCGLICGWKYGMIVGFILPLLRSAVFGMPVMFPMAVSMSLELMTYGFVAGFCYQRSGCHGIRVLYRSLLFAMLCGRLVWGMVQCFLLGMTGQMFTLRMFLTGAFIQAIFGIVLHLLVVPAIMIAGKRTGRMTEEQGPITTYDEVITTIQRLSGQKVPVILAIDGRCAAGKTTLAQAIQKKLDCPVIHMDDFFLQPHQRTEERLSMPGGNVDYERFMQEVLIPLKEGRSFSYRPYDCKTQQLKHSISVCAPAIAIVEGTYSCHDRLWDAYDVCAFLDVEKDEQQKRIVERNGRVAAKRFQELWIPLEEAYFTHCKIKERCRFYYKT